MRLYLATACLALCGNALAADEIGDVTEVVNFYGNCAGVWDFHADLQAAEGKPASAEQLRNMGNGAQTAALWLLANKHSLDTGKATTYGSWDDLVRPRRENGKLRMHALAEQQDFETIKAESQACLDAAEAQEKVLQMMREDRVRQAQNDNKNPG